MTPLWDDRNIQLEEVGQRNPDPRFPDRTTKSLNNMLQILEPQDIRDRFWKLLGLRSTIPGHTEGNLIWNKRTRLKFFQIQMWLPLLICKILFNLLIWKAFEKMLSYDFSNISAHRMMMKSGASQICKTVSATNTTSQTEG